MFALALALTVCSAGSVVDAGSASYVELAVPHRLDFTFDDAGILYITAGERIVRFDSTLGVYLTPFEVGGTLIGIDRSKDGHTLAVADLATQGGTNRIVLVDVATGQVETVSFPLDFFEGGTFMVAWGADDRVLVTSTFNGSGWVPLRRYDPATHHTDVLGSVRQSTMLTPNADRTTIGLAESNISSGPVHSYNVARGSIVASVDTNWFTFEVAVSTGADRFVVPTYGGAFVFDVSGSQFTTITTLGQYADHGPLSAVFSPTARRLYTAEWAFGAGAGVKVYDTVTWQQLDVLDDYPFQWGGNGSLNAGRIKISPTGRLIAVSVYGGVRLYRVGAI
jgi:hypothetical protein